MNLPSHLEITDASYALDGGTTTLFATDEVGAAHRIMLVQHVFTEQTSNAKRLPGRLYFDGDPVLVRSEYESDLIRLLRAAQLAPSSIVCPGSKQLTEPFGVAGHDLKRLLTSTPEENLSRLVSDLISFVESEVYVSVAGVL